MLRRSSYALLATLLFAGGYLLGTASPGFSLAAPGGLNLQQTNCQTFRETGQTVCGRFLRYWQENGGLRQQGFPISGEFRERSDLNGQVYTVQYFERAVFEYHPENQPPNDVLLSQLGTFRYRQRYGSGPPPANPPPAPPPAPQPTPTQAPMPPLFVDAKVPASRNGMTFTVTGWGQPPRRFDVLYELKNETSQPVQVRLAAADQVLVDDSNKQYFPRDRERVVNVTLQPGQVYQDGTVFEAQISPTEVNYVTFVINNLPRLGDVRVHIQLVPEP